MLKSGPASEWRESRRQSARDAIVDAAWALVHEEGLAALSLRDLARRAGITTPTVYAYFASKHAIYDAMFGRAAAEFDAYMAEPFETDDPADMLVSSALRFAEFCTRDFARYQLLFQRTIPGFDPSVESYAPAVRALQGSRARLARNGVTDPRQLDLWTALLTGLVDQQIANEPGGDRWTRLISEGVAMFLAHCGATSSPRKPRAQPASKTKPARR